MSSETITRNDLTNILDEIVAIDGTDMSAQDIQDFCDSLNISGAMYPKIQVGETAVITVSANSYYDENVTFDSSYSSYPAVVASFVTSSTAGEFGKCCVAVHTRTTTGFTIRVFNGDATTRAPVIQWIAIGV